MIWERALEADARLAAKNSVKIRAAIAQSFNAKRVFEQYLTTQPLVSNKPAQNRARARAWAILNVRVNMEPLKEVMLRVWAEGYVTGVAFAEEQVEMVRVAQKADDGSYIDWNNWKPGDQASALLLQPPRAFQQLLQMQSITFKDFSDTTVRDIGNAVADAIELGMNAQRSAKNIARHVANPARALTIAITEQNRAISYATLNRYKESEIEKVEWQTSSPCDECAQNQGQVIVMGATFNSGDTQPPVHPNCRCVLLPVIPDFADESGGRFNTPVNQFGVTNIAPAAANQTPRTFMVGEDELIYRTLKQEQGTYINSLTPKELKSVAGYQAEGTYDEINNYLRGKGNISPENKELIKTLDKVIDGTSLEYKTTVYRGISDDTGVFDNLRIGDSILEKGYSSTSPNPAVAEAFANSTVIEGKPIVLEIELPYKHPAVASDVASNRLFGYDVIQDDEAMIEITGFTRLNEVTLPRNMTFEVTELLDKENAKYVRVRPKK